MAFLVDGQIDLQHTYTDILETAIRIAGATRGTFHRFYADSGTLLIEAQKGFKRPFLKYFRCLRPDGATCGMTLQKTVQITISDVTTESFFSDYRLLYVIRQANVRAVQVTPVIDGSGSFMGIMTTYSNRVRSPDGAQLQALQELAHWFGQHIETYIKA